MNKCIKNMKLTAQDYDTCISQRLRPNSPADKYVIKKNFCFSFEFNETW